jgi:hypothetical protein
MEPVPRPARARALRPACGTVVSMVLGCWSRFLGCRLPLPLPSPAPVTCGSRARRPHRRLVSVRRSSVCWRQQRARVERGGVPLERKELLGRVTCTHARTHAHRLDHVISYQITTLTHAPPQPYVVWIVWRMMQPWHTHLAAQPQLQPRPPPDPPRTAAAA